MKETVAKQEAAAYRRMLLAEAVRVGRLPQTRENEVAYDRALARWKTELVVEELDLDVEKLAFGRWLVETGRVTDFPPGPWDPTLTWQRLVAQLEGGTDA